MTKNDANPEQAASIQAISEKALRRDRLRQFLLAFAAGLLWAMIAIGVLGSMLFVRTYLEPNLKLMWENVDRTGQASAATVKQLIQVTVVTVDAIYWIAIIMSGAIVVAGVTTLFYVRISHQASLRKIRGELADISAQLRAMS